MLVETIGIAVDQLPSPRKKRGKRNEVQRRSRTAHPDRIRTPLKLQNESGLNRGKQDVGSSRLHPTLHRGQR
jgi:hypothetical protein